VARSIKAGCLTAAILIFCVAARGQTRSDVFLITVDTLRADHVECYGYGKIHTPGLNQLARDGILFEQAFTPSPITTSSHASIFTGMNPSRHGVRDFGVPLRVAQPTWAERLKAHGYRTAAFIGSVVLDSKRVSQGFDRGFDEYANFPELPASSSRYGRLERRAGDVIALAESWLEQHPAGPRFVWLHLYDPHDPYDPPPPYAARYQGSPYDGEIAYADSEIEQFIDFLRKRGWYQQAVVLAVADHGEGLGEHEEQTHGVFLYDSTLHVPMIVKLPQNEHAGTRIARQARTIDLLPTVLQALGLQADASLDGAPLQDLFNDLRTGKTPEHILFAETDYPQDFGWAPLRAIREPDAKLVEAPRAEFYDLQSDPHETQNIYEPWTQAVQRMRDEWARYRSSLPLLAQAQPGAVRNQTMEELKALGYLSGNSGETNVQLPSLLPDPKDHVAMQNYLHRAMVALEGNDLATARAAIAQALRQEPDSQYALRLQAEIESRVAHGQSPQGKR
jgi:choline-sulfatase